jgi:hypothetical protein
MERQQKAAQEWRQPTRQKEKNNKKDQLNMRAKQTERQPTKQSGSQSLLMSVVTHILIRIFKPQLSSAALPRLHRARTPVPRTGGFMIGC